MTKPSSNPQSEYSATHLLGVLAQVPQGLGIDALCSQLPQIPRRSLQRQLAQLTKSGAIVRDGKARATRYRLSSPKQEAAPIPSPYLPHHPWQVAEGTEDYPQFLPLSEEGRALIAQIRRPLAARIPVAYDADWLIAYEPNVTFYLDEHTRTQLRRMGDTGMATKAVGTYGRDILDRLLIDLSWASSRLEGNTYSRLDTERLIVQGEAANNKDALETQMILNHKHAIEMLVECAAEIHFDRYTFLNLHGLLSENLMPDAAACGRVRLREVNISGTVYKPTAIPQLIETQFTLLLQKANAILDPFEQAFFILVHLPYLQAFEDVNKRVARIGANISFIKHNLCPLTFIEVPERAYIEAMLSVYELRNTALLRDVFVWAYERSAQRYIQVKKTLAEPEPLRLKYRSQLHHIVGDIVRSQQIPYTQNVIAYAQTHIPAADCEYFIAMALDDIQRLHEGVLVRYRLSPAEFWQWQQLLHRI